MIMPPSEVLMPDGDGIDAGAILVGYLADIGLDRKVAAVSLPTGRRYPRPGYNLRRQNYAPHSAGDTVRVIMRNRTRHIRRHLIGVGALVLGRAELIGRYKTSCRSRAAAAPPPPPPIPRNKSAPTTPESRNTAAGHNKPAPRGHPGRRTQDRSASPRQRIESRCQWPASGNTPHNRPQRVL